MKRIVNEKRVNYDWHLPSIDVLNAIEQQAFLAVKYCSEIVCFVLDLTESTPLEKQLELLKQTYKRYGRVKTFVVYLSKSDLLSQDVIDNFISENKTYDFYYDADKFLKFARDKAIKTSFND